MDIIKKNFGERLRDLRKLKNLTQEQLADRICINLRQLARIEAGESFITSETLYKICVSLEISPWELFNYNLVTENIKTGTDNVVYLNVIKSGEMRQITSKAKTSQSDNSSLNSENFDLKMEAMAKKLNKDIIVDEIQDGKVVCTKTFHPDGSVDTKGIPVENSELKEFTELKKKIDNISTDRKKLEFVSLAIDALNDCVALKELKTLIKGIELIQS